jgi:hypothetical protein
VDDPAVRERMYTTANSNNGRNVEVLETLLQVLTRQQRCPLDHLTQRWNSASSAAQCPNNGVVVTPVLWVVLCDACSPVRLFA